MARLMPLPLTVSCFSKIQIGFAFLVLADPGSPRKWAVKRACVCVFRFLVVCLVNRLDMMCVFVCKLRSLFLCSFFWRLVWFLQYHAKKLVGVNFQSSDMTYFVLSGM